MSSPSASYVDLLFGAEDGGFAELRFKLRNGGMGQDFVPLGDRERLGALLRAHGAKTDLYLGVAPRSRQEGTKKAIERLHVLYVDCDDEAAIAALENFEPAPSMVVSSGSGQHAYWSLWPPASPDEAEQGNRRLAHALGADARATDAARILRPPGTFNHKTNPPRPVEVEHMEVEVYTVEQVVGGLPDPQPEPKRRDPSPVSSRDSDDPLLSIPPAAYVEALTGQVVGRDGKVRCPFHHDRTPSLHVYGSPEAGWACFGCQPPPGKDALGGDIYAFAARLYGLEPRGRGFHEIRERLEAHLMAVAA